MAMQMVPDIINALAQTFPDRVVQTFNRTSVAAAILPITRPEGKNVAWDFMVDGAHVEDFNEGEDVVNFGSDRALPAVLSFGLSRANFAISNTAAAIAENSAGPPSLSDPLGRNMIGSTSKLASKINQAIYGGSGAPNRLFGLRAAISDTGTYAGIDRAAYAAWRSKVFDMAGKTLTLQTIRQQLDAIYVESGQVPRIAITGLATHTFLKTLLDPNMRYGRELQTVARGTVTLGNRSDVIEIEGCQFVRDKDCGDSELFYLDDGAIELQPLPQPNNWSTPVGAVNDGYNTLFLGFYAYELGRTGSSRKFSIESHLQLKVENPNHFGKVINIGH